MIDASRASLESRLDNWANASRGTYDPVDAAKIEAAWRCLDPHHRELLRIVYLWHASREVACRRLRIARHPRTHYELEVAAARLALTRRLENGAS